MNTLAEIFPKPRASRVVIVAACLTLALIPMAGNVRAQLPYFEYCTVPSHFNLVGCDGVTGDPAGEFAVVVRDGHDSPIPAVTVIMDFGQARDLHISTDQLGNSIVDCPTKTVRRFTDGAGVAQFRIIGESTGGPPSSFGDNVTVSFGGIRFGTVRASSYCLDGSSGGMGGGDLSVWLSDFGSSTNPTRSDYDGDRVVGGADLSQWLYVFGMGGSDYGTTSYCP